MGGRGGDSESEEEWLRCGPAPETRCISFNNGKGKKTAWRAWKAYDDVTEIFVHLAKHPFQLLDVDCQEFQKLERLTVILYDKSSPVYLIYIYIYVHTGAAQKI